MALDFDDPTTWPEDEVALAALADSLPESSDEPVETPAPDAKPAEEPEVEAPVAEPEADPDAPVLTADGKHYIPHSVLKEARERAVQAEAQMKAQQEQYQQQLVQIQQQLAQPALATPPEVPVTESLRALWDQPIALSETEQARIEQVRKDWGEDQAEALQQSYLALHRTDAQDKILRAQYEVVESQRQQLAAMQVLMERQGQQSQQAETDQIQAAIDQSPLLTAWQADQNSPYFDFSVKLNEYLMASDSAYAKLGWQERMALLPAKVEALHGVSPHSSQVGAVTPAPAAAMKAKRVASDVPVSHSDIVAGGTPPAASEVERLERMTPAQLQQHMASMSLDDLRGYLTQF